IQILVFLWNGIQNSKIFLLCKEVQLLYIFPSFIFCDTWLDNHISFVVYDHIQFLGRQSQKISNFVGKASEIPYMRYRYYQIDMSNPIASYFLLGYLNPTPVANDTFISNSFVFPT